MRWSLSHFRNRLYAAVLEQKPAEPGDRPWLRAIWLTLYASLGLLQVASYVFHEPERLPVSLDSLTNELRYHVVLEPSLSEQLGLELRLLYGLVLLIGVVSFYYFQRTWVARQMTPRRRVFELVGVLAALAIGAVGILYLIDNVEATPGLIDLVDGANDIALIALVPLLIPLPYVAFKRNAATIVHWWKTTPSHRTGLS